MTKVPASPSSAMRSSTLKSPSSPITLLITSPSPSPGNRFRSKEWFLVTASLLLLVAVLCLQVDTSTALDGDDGNPCLSKESCSECITSNAQCAWCKQEGYSTEKARRRCDYVQNLASGGCHETQIYHPGHFIQKLVDEELTNTTSDEGQETVQMKPQRVHLRLKPNSPYVLKLQFKQAIDYPVDLYYLMDLSKSMEDDKEKLAELGNKLAAEMKNITNNFRLGFGSFVDKVVMPYVSIVPEKLKEPCKECAAPYGYKHHMTLSKNSEQFSEEVAATRISGNLDAPEGGFDAMMQTVVCKKHIGWRDKSRKLLVFSTDSGFHYAGDGKLGGIVKPNDGMCHLDQHGSYTMSTSLDYPSISQINQKVQENHVNVIFAVTASQVDIYKKLSEYIEGSSAGKLMNDSSNVVELIKGEYKQITSHVELKDNATSNVKINYFTSCLGVKREETNVCRGLRVGTTVSFDAVIEVTACPRNPRDWNQTIQIYPVGLNDALIIDLELICDCECEKPWAEERNSTKCSGGSGTYECGICSCYGNRYGRECECDAKESDPATDELACYREQDTKPCSGRGVCRCGMCECLTKNYDERIYGHFCECDNFSCDRSDGKICSGPDQGTCDCGSCKCKLGWTGPACECRNTTDTCLDPKTNKICSGRGDCVCGECRCHESSEGHYTGKYCEECPTCRTQCEAFKECVQCQVFGTGPLEHEDCMNCTFMAIDVETLDVKDGETHCIFIDDDDCKFQFKYSSIEDKDYDAESRVLVYVQRSKDCPTPVNILAIVIGVILGIVLVGLALLLIWKLLTTIHDRREFAKFEKERMMAKWDTGENPIYKQATTTFKNPTYGGKQCKDEDRRYGDFTELE